MAHVARTALALALIGGGGWALAPPTSTWPELWRWADQEINARLPGVRPYPVDADLQSLTTSSSPHVTTDVHAYASTELRLIRAAVVSAHGAAPHALNFVIFPRATCDLPCFGADLITLPGGHLVCLDFHPMTTHSSDSEVDALMARLDDAHTRHSKILAWGGDLPEAARTYFSPRLLWSRLPRDASSESMDAVGDALKEYLGLYLDLVEIVGARAPLAPTSARAAALEAAQRDYCEYRAENDPARGMLTRLYGGDRAERLIRDFLFHTEDRLSGDL